jgi:hypothetical protein
LNRGFVVRGVALGEVALFSPCVVRGTWVASFEEQAFVSDGDTFLIHACGDFDSIPFICVFYGFFDGSVGFALTTVFRTAVSPIDTEIRSVNERGMEEQYEGERLADSTLHHGGA